MFSNKTYWFSVVASFITMGVVAMGMSTVLMDQFASLMAISRGEQVLIEWQMGGYVLITLVFVYIYAKGRENGGWQEGGRYGITMGLLMCGVSIFYYSALPLTLDTLMADMVINIVTYTAGGIVVSLLYKPA